MAKEKSEKKEKKEKKRAEGEGGSKVKKEKKEKRDEKEGLALRVLEGLAGDKENINLVDSKADVKVEGGRLLGALVPFANPLADDKVGKKVLKSVKKGNGA